MKGVLDEPQRVFCLYKGQKSAMIRDISTFCHASATFCVSHLLLQTLLAVRNLFKSGVVLQEGARCWGEQPVSSAMTFRSSSETRSDLKTPVWREECWSAICCKAAQTCDGPVALMERLFRLVIDEMSITALFM